jgi:membrane protein implicated in regulation of membrane protease activity
VRGGATLATVSAITLAFLVIGGTGVLALAATLVFGEFLGIGHLGHVGHPDATGPWSLEVIAGFLGAFGFAGAITNEVLSGRTTVSAVAAATVGLAAAVPTAYLAWRFSRAARNMRTDATPTRADLVGTLGVVVTPIPVQGYGEVRVRLRGEPVKLNARADRPIPMGAHVFVIEATSDTSVVVEQTELPAST